MSALSRRFSAVAVAVVLIAGTAAARASADTLNLTVSGSTDRGIVVTATGSAAEVSTLDVQYFEAGTGGCPNPPGGGTPIDPDGMQINNGTSFDVSSSSPVAVAPGSYQLCGWLSSGADQSTVTATFSGTFTVAAADTLSLAPPVNPVEGQELTVTASGAAYDPTAAIDATYKPAGGGCASTPAADAGTISDSDDSVSGQYSTQPVSDQSFDSGAYLVCVWLVDDNDGQVLASASTTLDVGALGASLQLIGPTKADPGEQFPLNLSATLDANIPVLAQADILPDHAGTACAENPDGEPTDAMPPLAEVPLTDTQLPAGAVSTSGGEAQLSTYGRYLICAWLLDGWSATDNPATVGGPISQTLTVVKPVIYRGHTSQRDQLSITIGQASRVVEQITAADQLRCAKPAFLSDGQPWNGANEVRLTSESFGVVHVGSHSIHVKVKRPGHTFDLSGRISGSAIEGTFDETGTPSALIGNHAERFRCTSGAVRFKLHES